MADSVIEIQGKTLKLTNLDKVLYPATGFTKRQVIDYYSRIAPVLLPHLEGRALTLKRYPDGVDGQLFYEKKCPKHRPPWAEIVLCCKVGLWIKALFDDLGLQSFAKTSGSKGLQLYVPLNTEATYEQ